MYEKGVTMAKHKKESAMKKKMKKVFHEYGAHELHSGSKKGPIVKKRKQAIAIALSEGRKAEGKAISKTMKKNKKKGYDRKHHATII